MLLLLKLILVPVLIAAVTFASRRWGARAGGWLTALPIVGGPTIGFYAVEQSPLFAAEAARGALAGVAAVVAFCVSYAHAAARANWAVSLLTGWTAFAAVTALIYAARPPVPAALLLALLSCAVGRLLLPRYAATGSTGAWSRWDLPTRMLAAAALVLGLTSVAPWIGPTLSGLFTPFPVATAVIAAFTHAQWGPQPVSAFFAGLVPALNGFAVFCFVLAVALGRFGPAVSFSIALVAQLMLQGALLSRATRKAARITPV